MSENKNDEINEKLHELDKSILKVKKDVEWQQKTAVIVGLLLLGFLGYTNFFEVPSEVRNSLKDSTVEQAAAQANAAAREATNDYLAVESIHKKISGANAWGWGETSKNYAPGTPHSAPSDGFLVTTVFVEEPPSNVFSNSVYIYVEVDTTVSNTVTTNNYYAIGGWSPNTAPDTNMVESCATLTIPVHSGEVWNSWYGPSAATATAYWVPLIPKVTNPMPKNEPKPTAH